MNKTKIKRILLTGATGQLGWELTKTLAPLGEILTPDRTEFNLAKPESLRASIQEWKPDLIVNPAAYTAVDKAEDEYKLAFTINAEAPKVLAEESSKLNIPLIHYSTDYVFDGKKDSFYTEEDQANPLNVYGASKLGGELAVQESSEQHIILRTSWIYSLHGQNFLNTMLRLFQEKEVLSIINDQVGAPTWSRMVAESTSIIVSQLTKKEKNWGLYHLTTAGETSWYGFAKAIYKTANIKTQILINPVTSSEYITKAIRPKNSRLDNHKIESTFGIKSPNWKNSLKHCLSVSTQLTTGGLGERNMIISSKL